MQGFNTEQLQEKWAPILDYQGMDTIRDSHRRAVTAILLENQERTMREEREFLSQTPVPLVELLVSLLMQVLQLLVSTQF
jgi:hypothetical protein